MSYLHRVVELGLNLLKRESLMQQYDTVGCCHPARPRVAQCSLQLPSSPQLSELLGFAFVKKQKPHKNPTRRLQHFLLYLLSQSSVLHTTRSTAHIFKALLMQKVLHVVIKRAVFLFGCCVPVESDLNPTVITLFCCQ